MEPDRQDESEQWSPRRPNAFRVIATILLVVIALGIIAALATAIALLR